MELRKWIPEYTRESPFSSWASLKLLKERVIPAKGGPLVMVKLSWSVPKKRDITTAAAPPSTLCVEG